MEIPQYPAGEFVFEDGYGPERRAELIQLLAEAPKRLRKWVEPLTDAKLDVKYRNWTIRQIVHHLADSHTNMYIRVKWTLTENKPTIKTYNETLWSELTDAKTGAIQLPLAMLEALHARLCNLFRVMTDEQFARQYHNPESGKVFSLSTALSAYVWHGNHHTAQIEWIYQREGW